MEALRATNTIILGVIDFLAERDGKRCSFSRPDVAPALAGIDDIHSGKVRTTTKSFYRVAEPEAHVRRCPDWYELQPRPRGTVLNPHMRCWWVRGP